MNNNKKSIVSFFLWWLLVFGLCILVRLPHFLSKDFWFDGDEAIIGIMAQDLLEGKNFPMYFYGQNYGLSTFEVFSTAIFEFFIGPSIWSLRLGGLLMYSLGIVFLIRTVQMYVTQKWLVGALALLLIAFPTWYLWGAMVRGGYVSAFMFSCIIFSIIFGKKTLTTTRLIVLGICIAIVFEAHLLILLGISSLLFYWMIQQENIINKGAIISVSFILTVILFRYFGYVDEVFWEAPKLQIDWKEQAYNLKDHLEGLLHGFSNFSFFEFNAPIPLWYSILLITFLIITTYCLLVFFFKSKDTKMKWFTISFLFTSATYLFLLSTMYIYSPRYWIGFFTGLLFILVYIGMTADLKSKFAIGVLSLLSLFGIFAGSKMKQHWYDVGVNEQVAFEQFHTEIKKGEFKALYLTDPLIQYQWNYYYGKDIPATMFRNKERVQRFCTQVNEIYAKKPNDVAIGGLWGIFLTMDSLPGFNDERYQVGVKYFVNREAKKVYVDHVFEVE